MTTRGRISFPQTVPHVPRVGVWNRIDLEGGDGIFFPAAGEKIAFLPAAAAITNRIFRNRHRARRVPRPRLRGHRVHEINRSGRRPDNSHRS